MTTREDIVDGGRLDEIEIRVLEAKNHNTSSLAWRLTVEDEAGGEFEVKIWHTHDVDFLWKEGWRYVLRQGLGKHRSDGTVILSSTSDMTVSPPEDVVDLLAMSDSHIGRENRPDDSNPPHHAVRQFVAAMGYANRYNVDAVVHAGDVFDDNPTRTDFEIAESGLRILGREDIPFHYIHGNHGCRFARELYDRVEAVDVARLGANGMRLGGTVELLGVGHASRGELGDRLSELTSSADASRRVLVFHNEIDPPRTASGFPACELFESLEPGRDHVLSGHLHKPETATYRGSTIQYLGSTANISAVKNAEDGSAWLIRVAPDDMDLNRIHLQ